MFTQLTPARFIKCSAKKSLKLETTMENLADQLTCAACDREIRHKQFTIKRRKLIQELNTREEEARNRLIRTSEELYMQRLREEGFEMLTEEQELRRQRLAKIQLKIASTKVINMNIGQGRLIKIKWKVQKSDIANGGYTQERLSRYTYENMGIL